MANTIGYGQGAVNNTNGFGKAPTNNTIDFGEVCADSWSPETNIVGGSSFSNTYSTDYDGIDAYISTDAIYSELNGGNKATFSMWIKPTSFTDSRMLFSITKDTTAGNSQVRMHIDTSARLRGFVSTGSTYIYTNASVLTLNTWHHILFCIDLTQSTVANRGRIFVDGVDQTGSGFSQLNETIFPTSNSELFIGEDKNGFLIPLLGNIDEFAIWSGTDLRNDVATLYNSGVPNNLNDNGLTAPTSWYRFEEGSGTTIADSGSSTNNATIQNSVTFETDVPT